MTSPVAILRPIFQVKLDGQDITSRIKPLLSSLSITSARHGTADQLDLVIDATSGRVALPRTGVLVDVMIGWDTGVSMQGSFTIDEVEHAGAPDQITIRGRSAAMASNLRTRRERSWSNTTIGSVVEQIAKEHNLTPRVSDKLASIGVTQIDQTESDMAMLNRLGKLWDAVATIKAGKLLFGPIGEAQTVGGTALPTLRIARSSGDQHRYHAADRDAYTGVRAHWHDFGSAGQRSTLAGHSDRVKVLRGQFASKEDADRAASAEMARVKRGAGTFELTLALGRPDAYPEMPAQVTGWNETIDGIDWIVTKASHSIDSNGGYTTKLELENKATASESPAEDETSDDGSEDEA